MSLNMHMLLKVFDVSFDSFPSSDGWLEKWKAIYGIQGTCFTWEVDDVLVPTGKGWIEGIPE